MPVPDSPPVVAEQLAELAAGIESLRASVARIEEELRDRRGADEERWTATAEALRIIHDDDVDARRRLRALRETPEYDDAFTAADPLVSVVIATWNEPEGLRTRSVASALEQTHANVEVVVVGDASPDSTRETLEAFDDPRVRFVNRTVRGPYPEQPLRAWMSAGTPGFNEAIAMARGSWIAPLGDDDRFDSDHVELLLARARETRAEFALSRLRTDGAQGEGEEIGSFPPRLGHSGIQASIYHAGLRFMELELAHALLDTPNDWGLIHRMMRVGVRMTEVERATVHYIPSQSGRSAQSVTPPPWTRTTADRERARDEVAELVERLHVVESELARAQADRARSEAAATEAEARHGAVIKSRAWRAVTALRRLRRLG